MKVKMDQSLEDKAKKLTKEIKAHIKMVDFFTRLSEDLTKKIEAFKGELDAVNTKANSG